MDVRKIVISEFIAVFERHGYKTPQELLRIAEAPFDLAAVQKIIDRDIDLFVNKSGVISVARRILIVRQREEYHEGELRKLSRQYAIKILEYERQGLLITESIALNEQLYLKEEAGDGCDMYPCAKTI